MGESGPPLARQQAAWEAGASCLGNEGRDSHRAYAPPQKDCPRPALTTPTAPFSAALQAGPLPPPST